MQLREVAKTDQRNAGRSTSKISIGRSARPTSHAQRGSRSSSVDAAKIPRKPERRARACLGVDGNRMGLIWGVRAGGFLTG